jgi:hypothetical protein
MVRPLPQIAHTYATGFLLLFAEVAEIETLCYHNLRRVTSVFLYQSGGMS